MNKKTTIACALSCSLFLSSCATDGSGPSKNQVLGTLAGCGVGIVAAALAGGRHEGSNATALCLAVGAAGFAWGSYLDERERRQLAEASMRAASEARIGQRIEWGGPAQTAQAQTAPVQTAQATPSSKHTKGTKHSAAKTPPASTANGTATSGTAAPVSTASNSNTDAHTATGWVIPEKEYVATNGQTCRDLKQVANKDGKTYEHEITSCKTDTGWVVPDSA